MSFKDRRVPVLLSNVLLKTKRGILLHIVLRGQDQVWVGGGGAGGKGATICQRWGKIVEVAFCPSPAKHIFPRSIVFAGTKVWIEDFVSHLRNSY